MYLGYRTHKPLSGLLFNPSLIAFFNGFQQADMLWTAMQTNMINYINTHGGHAETYSQKSYIARPDYETVKDYLDRKITFEQLKTKIGC